MNFLLYFIKLSKLRPYVSGNIDGAGLFFHTMGRPIFFSLQILAMFFLVYFIKLSNWDPRSTELLMGPNTMFWDRLAYLNRNRNFFRCRFISKNKLEIIELFAIFYQIVKIETLCLRQYWWGRPIFSYNVPRTD